MEWKKRLLCEFRKYRVIFQFYQEREDLAEANYYVELRLVGDREKNSN